MTGRRGGGKDKTYFYGLGFWKTLIFFTMFLKVKIDLFEMCRNLVKNVTTKTPDNLVKYPEYRLVSVIATVQRTTLSVTKEGKSLSNLVMDELVNKASLMKIDQLSRKPTFNGQHGEFTSRFLLKIILDETVRGSAKDYIWRVLIRDELKRGEKTRIFFKFSND